jgi:hypothetical protein
MNAVSGALFRGYARFLSDQPIPCFEDPREGLVAGPLRPPPATVRECLTSTRDDIVEQSCLAEDPQSSRKKVQCSRLKIASECMNGCGSGRAGRASRSPSQFCLRIDPAGDRARGRGLSAPEPTPRTLYTSRSNAGRRRSWRLLRGCQSRFGVDRARRRRVQCPCRRGRQVDREKRCRPSRLARPVRRRCSVHETGGMVGATGIEPVTPTMST